MASFWSEIEFRRDWKNFSHKNTQYEVSKMLKSLNFRFSEGRYFLNCDNTELKRSSKVHFSVANGIAGR